MIKIQEKQLNAARLLISSKFSLSYNCTFSELWATSTRAEDKTAELTINIKVKFSHWSKAKRLIKIHTGRLSQSPEKFISEGLELFIGDLEVFLQNNTDEEDETAVSDFIAELSDEL
jgi:hypothetical protein